MEDKKHKLYMAVRNYICNEMQITKDVVFNMIEERVKYYVDNYMSQTNLRSLIVGEILYKVKHGDFAVRYHKYWSEKKTLEEFIKEEIRTQMKDILNKNLSVNLNVNVGAKTVEVEGDKSV